MEANKENKSSALKQHLNDDLRQAMRQGDKVKVSVIRLVLSAMNYAEIARQATLTDADIQGVIAKEIRQRHESIEAFQKGNRADLVAAESAELAVLQSYMPQQLTRDEIKTEALKVINEVGAKGPSDKGKVMSKLMAQLKGKADGREINSVVTELLSS